MTQKLYRQDAYLKTNTSGVTSNLGLPTLRFSLFIPETFSQWLTVVLIYTYLRKKKAPPK